MNIGILIVFGAGFFLLLMASIFYLIHKNVGKNCNIKTEGEIINILSDTNLAAFSNDVRMRMYSPEIKFLVNGVEHISHPKVFTTKKDYVIGNKIIILYDENNPDKIVLEGKNIFKIVYTALYIASIVTFISEIILLITSK